MDLRFTDDEIAFRQEVRSFVRENLPPETRERMEAGHHPTRDDIVNWQRILNARGWAVPHWPIEWGGTDWGPVKQYIFREELQAGPAPEPLPFGVYMVGPVIAQFGNEAQKKRFLPRIANIDDWWCQGFSEPDSGSDLASVKTTAVRDGDDFIVNGQKTWTTLGQYADWIFCLVRTDKAAKKQAGISFLLIDMKSPGITVRPIVTIDGGREVNEVFFDDVRVPADQLVGEENKGWDYAKFLLSNERVGIARIGISKERLRRIRQIAAAELAGDGTPLVADRRIAERIAAIEIDLKALEITQMRVLASERAEGKGRPNPLSSILKVKGSQIQQATTEILLQMAGPYALPYAPEHEDRSNEPPVGPEFAAVAAPTYFNARKVSIYGGSNEIQRNIIAKAILGL